MGGDRWRYSRAESSSSSRAEGPRHSRSLDLARASATTSGEQSCDSDSVSDSDTASQHDETEWYSFNLSDAICILDNFSSIQSNKNIKKFVEDFNTEFKNDYQDVFRVRSQQKNDIGTYENSINIGEGMIIGHDNYKGETETWYLSDIVYHQLQLVMHHVGKSMSDFDLKSWYGQTVENFDTKWELERLLAGETSKIFYANTEGYKKLAKKPTAKSKFYLLKDHPEAFPGKQLLRMTIIQQPNGTIDIDNEYG